MIKKRLLTLADRLERIAVKPPKTRRFSIHTWLAHDSCGTQCCAVGEASFIPEFRRLGLTAHRSRGPQFKNLEGWGATTKFFGLTALEADYLFSSYYYQRDPEGTFVGPAEVAERIRAFVASNGVINPRGDTFRKVA